MHGKRAGSSKPMDPTARALVSASAVLAATLLAAAPASADEVVAELHRDTPIAAHGGALAWSQYDPASRRYRLVVRRGGVATTRARSAARRPFDVSLGPDAHGRLVALYTRCRTATRGCDVYRYDLASRRERRLATVSSPAHDEAWPVQWGDHVAFVRRARAYVPMHHDSSYHADLFRPDPRGKRGGGVLVTCDVPFVKTVSSPAPARRLDRGRCAETTGLSIRGERIVQVTDIRVPNVVFADSQVRRLSPSGAPVRVLARSLDYVGRYKAFASPSQSDSAVWLTRSSINLPDANDFVRIDLASKRLTRVRPNCCSPVAWRATTAAPSGTSSAPRPTTWTLSTAPAASRSAPRGWSAAGSCGRRRVRSPSASAPCPTPAQGAPRLRRALHRPAGDRRRRPHRAVVRRGDVVRREPLANVAIELLSRHDNEIKGPTMLEPTGRTTTTDAAGRWSFAVAQGLPEVAYAARAPTLGILSASIAVTTPYGDDPHGHRETLAGTVTPAQPGRLVDIERLPADAAGRPSGGCDPNATGSRTCPDWAPVAEGLALDAGGTRFVTTVSRPGIYRAVMSIAGPDVEFLYFGSSPAVRIG